MRTFVHNKAGHGKTARHDSMTRHADEHAGDVDICTSRLVQAEENAGAGS